MANSGFKNFIVNNGILNFVITIVSSAISAGCHCSKPSRLLTMQKFNTTIYHCRQVYRPIPIRTESRVNVPRTINKYASSYCLGNPAPEQHAGTRRWNSHMSQV